MHGVIGWFCLPFNKFIVNIADVKQAEKTVSPLWQSGRKAFESPGASSPTSRGRSEESASPGKGGSSRRPDYNKFDNQKTKGMSNYDHPSTGPPADYAKTEGAQVDRLQKFASSSRR